ncbi:tetratricopeptide repeat-containing sulfotransferase family protein [Arenimonas sp. MALMAid1274]|uniref:tetratricopeptide repeat-containing sulfotransferase family protein n=1 Tax=Arenimonas sp. MALMAid1274 TaxID=3411630 RepID=UPI003B9FCC14
MSTVQIQHWKAAEQYRASFDLEAAKREYHVLLSDPDWVLPASLRLGAIALDSGQLQDAVAHALAANGAREPDPVLLEALCRLLLNVGELQAAIGCVMDPSVQECTDPAVLLGLGTMMAEQGLSDYALPLLRRARRFGLETPELNYLIGNDESYAGNLDVAERELEACLRAAPDHAPAHRALAKLRRATPGKNHLVRLRAAASRLGENHPDAPLLHYALFKEMDDLGNVEGAWAALETGMRLRRRQVKYDSVAEQALFDELMHVKPAPGPDVDGMPQPLFIVGMPRSGTTLLERILGAHGQVADAGELRDFTVQLRWCCNKMGGPHLDVDLARAARWADLSRLGDRYLAHTQWHANGHAYYTDKLPTNFLNIGYIANALPQARFLHMVREPMDVCFSNLKELFADAYPHSYDQREMAVHFRRYQALMAHWHKQFPGRILDVHYDALVTEPETTARAVLKHCNLAWTPDVLEPESRGGTVATASSAQVREPIHTRFLGQWRRYESQLQPLQEALGS